MLVFAIFCSIVLLSLVIQWLSKNWLIATGIPCLLFIGIIFSGAFIPSYSTTAFFLGLPMIFFASLLGCYLYETRLNPDRLKNEKELLENDTDEYNNKTE